MRRCVIAVLPNANLPRSVELTAARELVVQERLSIVLIFRGFERKGIVYGSWENASC